MYVLTISNTVDNVFETNVYGDDTDLVSILKSFTPKTNYRQPLSNAMPQWMQPYNDVTI